MLECYQVQDDDKGSVEVGYVSFGVTARRTNRFLKTKLTKL